MDAHLQVEVGLHVTEHVQTSAAPLAPERIVAVGDVLEFVENESGHVKLSIEETRSDHIVNASVDDHVGVQELDSSPAGRGSSPVPRQDLGHGLQRVDGNEDEAEG